MKGAEWKQRVEAEENERSKDESVARSKVGEEIHGGFGYLWENQICR